MRYLVCTFLALSLAGSASAQQSAPPPDQSQPPPAAAAPADNQAAPAMGRPGKGNRPPNTRRTTCTEKARQQGLRGQQMKDSVRLCVDEARLACTKQAIEQKIPNKERKDFMRNCAG
jgi:hypothetical protein